VPYKPKNKVRFITAASLFDGHDASINIMRRILQSTGAEVIHLGHNRSVQEIVNARCRKMCRASPLPPTRAATSSISNT
jgi:methylmalonyl-CoA mutase cobalamin-binding subunit